MDVMPLSGGDLDSVTVGDETLVLHILSGERKAVFDKLFSSGVYSSLVEKELILEGQVSIEKLRTVITQKREFISYPPEWTIETLRITAQRILEMYSILDENGFGLRDCHPYNFILLNNSPRFVDMGSFLTKEITSDRNFPETEFLETYLVPLSYYRSKKFLLSRLVVPPRRHLSLDDFRSWRIPSFEGPISLLPRSGRKMVRSFFYAPISDSNSKNLRLDLGYRLMNFTVKKFKGFRIISFHFRIRTYNSWLKRMRRNTSVNQGWKHYNKSEIVESDLRFQRIFNEIAKLSPKTILDIGGSSGYLEIFLLKNSKFEIQRVIVTDKEESSLNLGIGKVEALDLNIDFVLFDFSNPWVNEDCLSYPQRFKSELVIALAITHHLLLTERMNLSSMIQRFASLTCKYLLIEFMPLGLWVPGAQSAVPKNYNIENFRRELKCHFDLVAEEVLEVNRVLFVCKLK